MNGENDKGNDARQKCGGRKKGNAEERGEGWKRDEREGKKWKDTEEERRNDIMRIKSEGRDGGMRSKRG